MRSERFQASRLVKLLKRQKIATMKELKAALGTEVDVTVFRKLRQLAYRASYSHRGCYYTLDEIARFDERGLWLYRSVGFSVYGTLISTVEAFCKKGEAGYFASELENVLQVGVKEPLLNLVRDGRVVRQKVSGRYLYCSPRRAQRQTQLLARELQEAERTLTDSVAEGEVSDELKAAIVLFFSLLDEKQRRLYAALESLKVGHGGDRKLADLLGLDVGTVAKGRHELLQGGVEPGRVRKPGAGRKPVKKKRRK